MYTNENGLTDGWGRAWAKIADKVKDLNEVIGLELTNEPMPLNPYTGPLKALVPWLANGKGLMPAYDILSGYIREADEDALIVFPIVTWSDLKGHTEDLGFTDGFEHPPGGEEYANKTVLAYHYYPPPQDSSNIPKYINEFIHPNADRLSTGMLLTETMSHSSSIGEVSILNEFEAGKGS